MKYALLRIVDDEDLTTQSGNILYLTYEDLSNFFIIFLILLSAYV